MIPLKFTYDTYKKIKPSDRLLYKFKFKNKFINKIACLCILCARGCAYVYAFKCVCVCMCTCLCRTRLYYCPFYSV